MKVQEEIQPLLDEHCFHLLLKPQAGWTLLVGKKNGGN